MSLVLSAIRGSLWRSLPLFRVKKFNSQEMDGRTLKAEIGKSGAPAARRQVPQQRPAQRRD